MSKTLPERLASLDCEALLVVASSSRDPDLAPFVGPVRLGQSLLVVSAKGRLRLAFFTPMEREEAAATGLELLDPELLDIPRASRDSANGVEFLATILERALHLCELPPARVALAGHLGSGLVYQACRHLEGEGWSFVAGEDLLLQLRKCKTAAELEEIRRAAAGVRAALRRVAELLRASQVGDGDLWLAGERLTVDRLRRRAAEVLAAHALEQPEGSIVAPAEEGAVPHTQGSPERVLRAGETLVVDLFPRGRLFADCTRTFCVGEAPAVVAAAHRAVREALDRAKSWARPGARTWEMQEAVCGMLAQAGYPTPISHPGTTQGYVHGLGHGVGFELHEYPSFRHHAGDEGLLAEGDVLTLEPGLYDPAEAYGVRLEDLCYVGPDGLETLTPLPYDMDPRVWVP